MEFWRRGGHISSRNTATEHFPSIPINLAWQKTTNKISKRVKNFQPPRLATEIVYFTRLCFDNVPIQRWRKNGEDLVMLRFRLGDACCYFLRSLADVGGRSGWIECDFLSVDKSNCCTTVLFFSWSTWVRSHNRMFCAEVIRQLVAVGHMIRQWNSSSFS